MEKIDITRKDVIWSYIAKFFQIGSSFITLPLILHMLTPEEVGMNYLMLTVSSMVALLDFGFAPQFGRNFTYVYSGAQRLLKEGVEYSESKEINYHLLSVLLKTAKVVYRRLSLVCLGLMLTAGSAYIYYVTNGFTNVDNSFYIWLFFSISTYFNIYFTYYNSLLTGSGKIAEQNVGSLLSRITYLIVCITLLYFDLGLFSVVIANFVAPFVVRVYSYKVYFTKDLLSHIDFNINNNELADTFLIIWSNAKKLGINFLGSYAINKSAMFIIGFYLPLAVVGSYGLLIQISSILLGFAQTLFFTYQPKFGSYRVSGCKNEFKILIGLTFVVYSFIMIFGSVLILVLGPAALSLINSQTSLPDIEVQIVYLLAIFLEGNHSNFATLIVTGNKVPFVKAAIFSGTMIVLLTLLSLQFTNLSLLGVVLVQFTIQLIYNNWRWPKWVLDEFNMSMFDLFDYGFIACKQAYYKIIKSSQNT